MRSILLIIFLQAYAVLLALSQWMIGVRTDEAKYLLDIAYPHPPLVRMLFGLTKSLIFQEFVWRLVLATLCVQAVWLVWRLLRDVPKKKRFIACGAYLLSGALVLQAGTIMMAPLTALQGLVLLILAYEWMNARSETDYVFLGLFWLVCLFTAYQAVLFMPLVISIVWRSSLPRWKQIVIVGGPILVLILYSLTNPLALASMLNVASNGSHLDIAARMTLFLRTFLTSGTVIVSLTGVLGLLVFKRSDVLITMALIALYVFLSPQEYYAIVFLPFLILGLGSFLRATPFVTGPGIIAILFAGILLLPHPPRFNLARTVSDVVPITADDDVMIIGTFGHEWQYYLPHVIRYSSSFDGPETDFVICLHDCPKKMIDGAEPIDGTAVPVYHNL